MSSFDKYTNLLDDKKEAVVTTPFLEMKLLTTEKITTSDKMYKRAETICYIFRLSSLNHPTDPLD